MLLLCFLPIFLITLSSCGQDEHFLTDDVYKKQVKQDFEVKKKQLLHGDLFHVFNQKLSLYEREALMFLYAYMPIGDITDYSGDYFLENIRLAKQAKMEMPWGRDIPEDIFRHFVLPIRVNNENLDDSRRIFYAELKERVGKMNLYDAVLEVNHWCHEKVIYTPSDARTSSPLASVRTAYGRCGEESTFTVAALRAVGIPARQVYTPRWAHTDDNHAWVEAWVDGKWYFLGACEPEPVLNLGWFNTAASRSMLMHSKVFGRYEGKEEIMLRTPVYTEINLIQNYAPTGQVSLKVTDKDGKPVENAKVEFKIYNYAEFYTAATRYTDHSGLTSLSAGRGDMLVWASKEGAFGYARVSFGKDERIQIVLDKKEGETYSTSLDIIPPPESADIPEVTPEQRAENNDRLAHEDSVRNAYTSTFMDKDRAEAFVGKYALPEKAAGFLVASRGNWKTLDQFLTEAKKKNAQERAVHLLSVISDKDLRDVSIDVLEDHLYHTLPQQIKDTVLYNTCIMNPRVSNEMILPYKEFFRKAVSANDMETFRNDPQKLVEWCKNNIVIKEELNLPNMFISPVGVWRARVSDHKSLKIFFVSLARSLGIPSWLDEITAKIQYKHLDKDSQEGQVLDVDFDQSEILQSPVGRLELKYKPVAAISDPKYYTHFSISKFKDGTFHLLNYEEGDVDMGGGTSWNHSFKKGVSLDTGYYMLVSGVRQKDGSVLSRMSFFNIEEGKTTAVDLTIHENNARNIEVIGQFDAGSAFLPLGSLNPERVSDYCNARSEYYILAVLGVGQEPTNHALRDIAALSRDFEKWGQRIILLFRDEEQSRKFRAEDFPGLPSTIIYGIDKDHAIQRQLAESLRLSNKTLLPLVIVANTSNEVIFSSQGYTIGLGEQLIKEINLLAE